MQPTQQKPKHTMQNQMRKKQSKPKVSSHNSSLHLLHQLRINVDACAELPRRPPVTARSQNTPQPQTPRLDDHQTVTLVWQLYAR